MQYFQLGSFNLYSLKVFEADPEVRAKLGSVLTEEFEGITLDDLAPLRSRFPDVFVDPGNPQDPLSLVYGNHFLLQHSGFTLLVDTGIGYPGESAPYSFALPNELTLSGFNPH